jgi:predicted aspartyl protease
MSGFPREMGHDRESMTTLASLGRLLGVALCLLAATSLTAFPVPADAPITIPFTFATKQPIVPVQVNGGPAVPFVVDTGASIHVIDREIARQASVGGGRAVPLTGGGQATVQTQFVDGVALATGDQAWPGQRAALAPLGYPERKHFAGLLGAPLLMRYTVQFDFPARIIRLFDPATYTSPAGGATIPFELQEDLPIVHVSIDAGTGPIDARLMVDTGASTFIDLNRPFVEKHKLVEAMPDATAADRPAALGGTAPFLYGTARRVSFAGATFDRPRIGLSRATSGSSSRRERDGIIGNAVLEMFVMTVDYRRRLLVFLPPPGRLAD